MREIKFRGKCIKGRKTGQFVYGDLLHFDGGETSIRTYDADGVYTLLYAVDPATVGQFTGLRDRNGVEIYEGDIVDTMALGMFEVIFDCGAFRIAHGCIKFTIIEGSYYEVVGNVHDSPELLK